MAYGARAQRRDPPDPGPYPANYPDAHGVQGLHEHRERLYTILTELFSNALEHGLLGLDSAIKHEAQGFITYYTERTRRLAHLSQGCITINLHHTVLGDSGQLTIRLEDSGPGFAHQDVRPAMEANTTSYGRGIPLVRSLCQDLRYYSVGNCVEALYVWS
ncbi:MAG: ATP-binding protein [Candidatus Tectomicrobia bacterium]|uniref:ATP-binding protein n=1 Tax=Tectimicrobiota bacterium TaxID=2528274 RepID=A0A937W6Y7_UNCTE|nr:ATP-binding protein [Candidatus Tectomicrobia bacterium]